MKRDVHKDGWIDGGTGLGGRGVDGGMSGVEG